MARTAALQLLQRSTQSIHSNISNESIVSQEVENVRNSINAIVYIVESKSGSAQDLEENLWNVSTFFREQKFSTVVLSVLIKLAKDDTDKWSVAKKWDTQIPLEPKVFETMKWSTAEIKGAHGVILHSLERERELALLSIYGITSQILGETFRLLSKNKE